MTQQRAKRDLKSRNKSEIMGQGKMRDMKQANVKIKQEVTNKETPTRD